MPDDISGPLQKNTEGNRREIIIIIFPCNLLKEKALESRNQYFFLHFLPLNSALPILLPMGCMYASLL